jgi:hypothetical protein
MVIFIIISKQNNNKELNKNKELNQYKEKLIYLF